MIDIFHASDSLRRKLHTIDNERDLIQLVMKNLSQYRFATRVEHSELDIAFAASGGPSHFANDDAADVACTPQVNRPTEFNDILLERQTGYINLSTPAGFIPLVDAVERNGFLHKKLLS
ncbi:hypothetical protein FX988_03084 [Paraglaciecola mesophila]|uniref:Uncharacterized protein n=1 Tax=Paraglaciecola mesophila TaxID=197222 RepID=A0A857JMT7_9ALTE|nr:hypothetical protein [Paraglaciecola mesophila]QHJ12826.1 hypothetical protein FX988_03084 [Paraglaciecola mesophila]